MLRIEPSWHQLLDRLEAGKPWSRVLVAGPADAGKTSLCRFLGAELAKRGPTAAIDCDPGQSALGPPAAVASAWEPVQGSGPSALRFVGSTSPQGHFLQTLTGISHLAERAAREGARRVVFDSSGYMDSGAGREFHQQTVDLLEPDHLVVLDRRGEMDPLLACFERREAPRLHRLGIPAAATPRSREDRRAYRRERFAAYFRPAERRPVPLSELGLHGMVPDLRRPASCRNLLVALCDRRGFAAVLGIVEAVDPGGGRLEIAAPPFDLGEIASLQFGSLRLDRSGRQLS